MPCDRESFMPAKIAGYGARGIDIQGAAPIKSGTALTFISIYRSDHLGAYFKGTTGTCLGNFLPNSLA
jgi:hypothetical protein